MVGRRTKQTRVSVHGMRPVFVDYMLGGEPPRASAWGGSVMPYLQPVVDVDGIPFTKHQAVCLELSAGGRDQVLRGTAEDRQRHTRERERERERETADNALSMT